VTDGAPYLEDNDPVDIVTAAAPPPAAAQLAVR